MQVPKKEAAEEAKSPAKTTDKKNKLAISQVKLSIDIEPLLTFFEKKVTVSKTKLNKMS
jgi:hypothetical protein